MNFTAKDFIQKDIQKSKIIKDFIIEHEAPSNIALVKYWGKHGLQLPMNPSVSFTLHQSKTITSAQIKRSSQLSKHVVFTFYLEGKHQPDFEPKIAKFFNRIIKYVPFIKEFKWIFDSKNTFPHSSGIASSASGFAALSKIIMNLEQQLFPELDINYIQAKTSFLARLGSGSAARSLAHPVMIWGEHPQIKNSSDIYAIQADFKLHPIFHNFQDSIVLVEKEQKKISSSIGHKLMETHPYKEMRKTQAFVNSLQMLNILKNGNIEDFIRLVEQEALSLHALMMTSKPNYLLMQAETLKIIHAIRNYRKTTNTKVCFTLDAGANIHVLYPDSERKNIIKFLQKTTDCEIIYDYI